MTLEPGAALGPYSITAKIGEGGMGEVYRARDTGLDRDVAIKVLPEAFVTDPDRLARFEREAKVLASLNHPNIAGIHGLEESEPSTLDGTSSGQVVKALVLELVEGPTLADRIALRRSHGARNVNFVGGLPDVNVLFILRTLQLCQRDTHVVWNTNIWTTETAIARLSGVVGTWLVDLKFANDECARALGAPAGYWTKMQRLFPIVANTGRVLVRHLVMPGHIQCCTRGVLEWLAKHHQAVTVNLMTGYQPFQLAGGSGPMARRLSDDERQQALALFDSLSFASAMVDGAEWP